VLLYDSSSKFNYNNHASFLFELCAYLFDDLELKGVEFAYIDVNNGTLASELTREESIYPHVQVIPAERKDETPYPHTNITDIESLLNFIKNNVNADVKKLFDEFEEYQDSEGNFKSENAGEYVESVDDNREKKEDL
jgi:hypothetical protein